MFAQVAVASFLLVAAALSEGGFTHVYRLGDWPSAFGIVLVLDRLSALMVTLGSVLGLCALVFSLARWHRAGSHFHPLFQFQIMGLSGSFLTGDIFNLFVFFEVMLAASYAMALHGQQTPRIRASLHYVVINLVASLLFLIGASMLYGLVGTLNMADLSARMALVPPADHGLVEGGAAILAVAFLIKAGMWPLGFWLPGAYAAASAPAAAILSILSKVGLYAVLRLWLLLFGDGEGPFAGFGGTMLVWGGLLTIAYGSLAVLATQNMPRFAGASILVSSGTLLAAFGVGNAAVTSGALFYMASSVFAIGGFFLLIELVERGREAGAVLLSVTRVAYGDGERGEDEVEEVGVAIPAPTAVLGISFVACALVIAGLPPLSGFLAKFAILAPLWGSAGPSTAAWSLLIGLVASSLVSMIAMARSGIDVFWTNTTPLPPVRIVELAPVVLLIALCLGLTIQAGPVMAYMNATAQALHAPSTYMKGVLPPASRGEP
jgi:multicomponent K+:H+ antiporter subunit D